MKFHDTAEKVKACGARSREMVERGGKPPHRAAHLIHGDVATAATANPARGVAEGRIIAVEILSRRRG